MLKTLLLFAGLVAVASSTTTQKPVKRKAYNVSATSNKAPKYKAPKNKSPKYKAPKYKAPKARRSYQQAPTEDRYKEIQQALAAKGYLRGDTSGKWDADSVEALKRFQTDQNLSPDGKINSLSLIAMGLGPKRLAAQTHPQPPPEAPKSDVPR
jgi:peptidoglycan hydrolase-like protein with peptidoglycan-binding domain